MTLYEKIMMLYPQLTIQDFIFVTGLIHLQNNSDGLGDFIAAWDHPTLARPTSEQLEAM